MLVYYQVPRPKDVTRGTRSLKEFSSELIKGETRLLQVIPGPGIGWSRFLGLKRGGVDKFRAII